MDAVRVRVAPSPTGNLHLGTARTALFNFLFARKFKGTFILRIDDTDKERSKKEYEDDIVENLKWLGLKWDEFYRQSERTDLYANYLKKLIADEKAYFCFCAKENLEKQREDMLAMGRTWQYPGTCRTLAKEVVSKKLSTKEPHVIRLKVSDQKISFRDIIRGDITFEEETLYDFIIAKDLREPLYNFASTIDDYELKISHVMRGEDHISNTPKQLLILKALGASPPQYAHLPLILGMDRSKLSKRKGAVTISDFRSAGFLPAALINFLVLLGWHPREDKPDSPAGGELLSLPEIIDEFSVERIQKGGAAFNENKLLFMNNHYIRKMRPEDLLEYLIKYFPQMYRLHGDAILFSSFRNGVSREKFVKILELEKERLKTLRDLETAISFFFDSVVEYGPELLVWKKSTSEDALRFLEKCRIIVLAVDEKEFAASTLKTMLDREAPEDKGRIFWPLRAALSGKSASPPPFEIMEILGKTETLRRIEHAIHLLKK